jgi:hypothetical protein
MEREEPRRSSGQHLGIGAKTSWKDFERAAIGRF